MVFRPSNLHIPAPNTEAPILADISPINKVGNPAEATVDLSSILKTGGISPNDLTEAVKIKKLVINFGLKGLFIQIARQIAHDFAKEVRATLSGGDSPNHHVPFMSTPNQNDGNYT